MADNTNEKSGARKIDYDFAAHERPLFQAWMDAGYFQRTPELGAGRGACKDQPYTIVIPPPNITGQLPSMPRTSVCSLSHVRLCRGGGAYAPGGVKIIDKR